MVIKPNKSQTADNRTFYFGTILYYKDNVETIKILHSYFYLHSYAYRDSHLNLENLAQCFTYKQPQTIITELKPDSTNNFRFKCLHICLKEYDKLYHFYQKKSLNNLNVHV